MKAYNTQYLKSKWSICLNSRPTKSKLFDHLTPGCPALGPVGCSGSSRDAVVCSDAPWPGSLETFDRPRNYDGLGQLGR